MHAHSHQTKHASRQVTIRVLHRSFIQLVSILLYGGKARLRYPYSPTRHQSVIHTHHSSAYCTYSSSQDALQPVIVLDVKSTLKPYGLLLPRSLRMNASVCITGNHPTSPARKRLEATAAGGTGSSEIRSSSKLLSCSTISRVFSSIPY